MIYEGIDKYGYPIYGEREELIAAGCSGIIPLRPEHLKYYEWRELRKAEIARLAKNWRITPEEDEEDE